MPISQYDYGEYEEEPLLFSKEFAFEFLIVTRGIMAGDIIINPRYLLLADCLDELLGILPEDQKQIYKDDYIKNL